MGMMTVLTPTTSPRRTRENSCMGNDNVVILIAQAMMVA